MQKVTYSTTPQGEGEARLKEMILYISRKCAPDHSFGAIKLNKILWWSDFMAYAQHGEGITGVEYQRLAQGPAPRRLVPARQELIADERAVVLHFSELGGYTRKVIHAKDEPCLTMFSAAQIAIVDEVIERVGGLTASTVSNLSHGKAWEIADDGESIPYEAVFLSDEPVDAWDKARTIELAAQFGW
jgi:hypothetical protein